MTQNIVFGGGNDMNASLCGALLAALGLACAIPAHAQYATKPVRLIVPFPPGGGSDTLARLVSPKLGEALQQPVIVENRPGGGTNIGAEIAAKAPADGYTLLMGNISHAINASLYSKLGYDLVRDFAPVTLLASTPNIVVVHPSVPVKSVQELVALAKARPGQLDYASAGSGSSSHLAGELFGMMTGARMTHVPYKGGGPAVAALLGGQCSVGFATTPSVLAQVRSGKLRALAVTTAQRSPSTPELMTLAEAGVPGYEAGTWYGFLVPTGTPGEIVARLNAETLKLLKASDTRGRLETAGLDVIGSTPEQFGSYIRSEIEKWAKVVKVSGARAD
jgi:tripartite-type tricarboxylate transporter receptor subunit TctC